MQALWEGSHLTATQIGRQFGLTMGSVIYVAHRYAFKSRRHLVGVTARAKARERIKRDFEEADKQLADETARKMAETEEAIRAEIAERQRRFDAWERRDVDIRCATPGCPNVRLRQNAAALCSTCNAQRLAEQRGASAR